MTPKEAIEKLQRLIEINPDRADTWRIVIPTQDGGVGGKSCQGVREISCGFDWDHGKVFLWPEKSVQTVKPRKTKKKPERNYE